MSRLRIGVVGCGWVATNRHLPALRRTGLADVVALYDRNPERARQAARRTKATAWGDVDAMLRQGGLDAVVLCTPPHQHAGQAVAALRAGANVLVEKPMALDPAQADGMLAAARQSGKTLAVSHNFLHSRAVSRIERDLASGAAGDVVSFTGFQMSTPRRRLPDWYADLPGQLFFDEAPHLLYLATRFVGKPEVVAARATPSRGEGPQRTAQVAALLAGDDGPSATLNMAFDANRSEWGFVVAATRRSYVVDLFRDIVVPLGPGGRHSPAEVLRQSVGGLARATAAVGASGMLYSAHRLSYGHDAVVRRFCEAVAGDGAPTAAGEAGAANIATLTEICRKAGLSGVP